MLGRFLLMVVFIVVVWAVWKWYRVRRYWAERGVPHDLPHPVLGSLTFLQKENAGLWVRRLYTKFNAPYVGIWLFWRPALVINCPDLAKRILIKDAHNFRNRFVSAGKSDPVGSLNLFTLNDPLWSNVRRHIAPAFTSAKVRNFERLVREKTDDLIERYKAEVIKNLDGVDIRVINTDYTTDLIGETTFGIRSEATKTGDSVLRKITRDFMTYSVFRGLSLSSIFFLPEIVDIFRFTIFPKDTISFLGQLFRKIVEQRGGFDRPVKDPKDILDSLLKMRQDAMKENEVMSVDLLLAQAAALLQGGFESSGAALSWTFKELAHSPEVQEKLYQELNKAIEKLGGEFNLQSLAEVPYLTAVIKETLRKYPSMGWLDRVSTKDYQLTETCTIPAGMPVYVNVVGIQMDPQYFPDPDKYDPERFMNEKNIKSYTFMPFGEGPRICIGMRFAYFSIRCALASIVLNFVIRPPAGAVLPDDWPVDRRGLLYIPEGKVPLIFTSRH